MIKLNNIILTTTDVKTGMGEVIYPFEIVKAAFLNYFEKKDILYVALYDGFSANSVDIQKIAAGIKLENIKFENNQVVASEMELFSKLPVGQVFGAYCLPELDKKVKIGLAGIGKYDHNKKITEFELLGIGFEGLEIL